MPYVRNGFNSYITEDRMLIPTKVMYLNDTYYSLIQINSYKGGKAPRVGAVYSTPSGGVATDRHSYMAGQYSYCSAVPNPFGSAIGMSTVFDVADDLGTIRRYRFGYPTHRSWGLKESSLYRYRKKNSSIFSEDTWKAYNNVTIPHYENESWQSLFTNDPNGVCGIAIDLKDVADDFYIWIGEDDTILEVYVDVVTYSSATGLAFPIDWYIKDKNNNEKCFSTVSAPTSYNNGIYDVGSVHCWRDGYNGSPNVAGPMTHCKVASISVSNIRRQNSAYAMRIFPLWLAPVEEPISYLPPAIRVTIASEYRPPM